LETNTNQISFTTTNTTATNMTHFSAITTGAADTNLRNPNASGYLMRLSQTATGGLTLNGVDNGVNTIKSNGAASTLKLDSAGAVTIDSISNIDITSGAGVVTITSAAGNDVSITGGQDVNITASAGNILLNAIGAGNDIDIDSGGDLNLTGTDINYLMPTAGIHRVKNNSVNRFTVEDTKVDVLTALNVTGLSTLTGGFTSSASSNMNHNFLLQQSTYPPTSTSALGYTDTETTTTNPMSNTLAERSNFDLPSKGMWLVICGYEFSSGAVNTIQFKQVVLSKTTASATPAAGGLQYIEQLNDAAGAVEIRQQGTITGVVTATAATTIYVNARSQVSSGTNTKLVTNVSWTRIG
jgi:hypothetical protein